MEETMEGRSELPELFEEKRGPAKIKDDIKKWQRTILKTISIKISKKQSTEQLSFKYDNFPPEHIHIYQELQEEIAKLLSLESERPTITVYIRGKNRLKMNDVPDIGLLGSTGSSSDAQIVTQLIEKRKEEKSIDDLSMALLSSPPFQENKTQSLWKKSPHHKQELNMISLAAIKCPLYVILSNSMHPYKKILSRKIDTNTSHVINLGQKSHNQMVNLLHEQLESIKQKKLLDSMQTPRSRVQLPNLGL